MFGDDLEFDEVVAELLEEFSLEDILEMNDLTDAAALIILIRGGHISEPERIFDKLNQEGNDDEYAD